MQDIYFDNVSQTFSAAIYETSRGYIRLGVLWEDLCQAIPQIKTETLRILDVGGGMGQISIRLAKLGHEIVLVDPSEDMLNEARDIIKSEGLENVSIVCSTAQDLSEHIQDSFDLVMCHAVLEWVASPTDVIQALSKFIKPSGKLSLMFMNQNSSILKTAFRGDFELFSNIDTAQKVEQSLPEQPPEGILKGARSLQAKSIIKYLEQYNLTIESKSSIRIFHDHIPDELKQHQLAKLLQFEISYRNVEPFASLGQHIHLVCYSNN